MKFSQTFKQDSTASLVKSPRFRQVGTVSAVILLILLASAAVLVFRAYIEGKEIREYVGGPFSSQLLYLQGCAPGTGNGVVQASTAASLLEQFDECRRAAGGRPGYYVYDFNIGRSVSLSRADMEQFRKYKVLTFPDSVTGRVGNSLNNPFNKIIPFEEFMGFEHDCSFSVENQESSCSFAPVKCDSSRDAISCSVFDPRTGRFDSHIIKRDRALELLLPQGYINGPDLFKLLKPRFFPVLER
ncbi:MAG: hypothetical protein F4Z82_01675 [Caldilineaceae bacterium SB0668_bin_21]|nr:hypothetical protein [Caldilineaceae bacterium SB0668_bin_21]MYC19989.1 hypothetical protein [Caldilineaceae bacterium SB0662_bin_25]